MSKGKSFVAGVVLGSLAAGAAAFFTSEKGKEATRNTFQNNERFSKAWEDIKEEGAVIKEQLVKISSESFSNLKEIKDDFQKTQAPVVVEPEVVAEAEFEVKNELEEIKESVDTLEKETIQ